MLVGPESSLQRRHEQHHALFEGKNVYEGADPYNFIRVTDYLKNPRPIVEKEEPIVSDNDLTARYNSLLSKAITSFNSASAKELVNHLSSMRSQGVDQNVMSQLLDNLLENGPDGPLPFWSRWRFLSRFSKRARLFTLRRALNLITPPPSAEEDNDSPDEQQRRRRRALISLLRTLAGPMDDDDDDEASSVASYYSVPAIVLIANRARKEHNTKSSSDMRSRLPADLETPNYNVIMERDGYEIRRYDPFSVCCVSMTEPRPAEASKTDAKTDGGTWSNPKMGGAKAFGALAGYLFGKNQENTAMKMTTPVISRGEEGDRTMSFVMPSEFWKDDGLSTAPKPLEGSGVVLERVQGEERAVIMFGGYASKAVVDVKTKQLLEKLQEDSDWMPHGDEPAFVSQYNDPFTPPWKRLNEVSVAVTSRT